MLIKARKIEAYLDLMVYLNVRLVLSETSSQISFTPVLIGLLLGNLIA